MAHVVQDFGHPTLRPGGEWILVVMLVLVLAVLIGGGALMVRYMNANPPVLPLPVPLESPSS